MESFRKRTEPLLTIDGLSCVCVLFISYRQAFKDNGWLVELCPGQCFSLDILSDFGFTLCPVMFVELYSNRQLSDFSSLLLLQLACSATNRLCYLVSLVLHYIGTSVEGSFAFY